MDKSICVDCITGTIAKGTPTGEVVVIGGVNAYIAKSKQQSKSAIVIATDVFGFKLPNVRLIADKFSELCGCLVVVPDLFNGEGMDPSLLDGLDVPTSNPFSSFLKEASLGIQFFAGGAGFLLKHMDVKPKIPIFEKVLADVRQNYGIEKIGVQGYCYGGKIAVLMGHTDQIQAFVAAHPSLLTFPDDIAPLKIPGLFLLCEIDRQFPKEEKEKSEKILKDKGNYWTFVDYPGMTHGFAIRGNSVDKVVSDAAQDCFNRAVQFFKERLQN